MARLFRRVPRYSIGIDFGTTTTRLCYFDNTQELNVPPNITPIRTLVTPIPREYGDVKYSWHVGEDVINSHWAHYSLFKLEIGKMQPLELTPRRKPDEKIEVRPELLAARIMWELYSRAVHDKKELSQIRDVAITVPAEWSAIQRQATIMAGKIAGFSSVHLIEEPVAAYLAIIASHQSDQITNAENILVFDYGGGTLDITVIYRPDQGVPYVIGRSMNSGKLGGEAIDVLLTQKVVGSKVWDPLSNRDKRFLADIIRQMKESLNPEPGKKPMGAAPWPDEVRLLDNPDIIFPENSLVLDQKNLDDVLEPISGEIIKHIDTAIQTARSPKKKISKDDIHAVLLVGGSSYLRKVQVDIKNYFLGKDFNNGIFLETPERIVAVGAALYKSYIDRGQKKFQVHIPMHTYLEYEIKKNDFRRLPLDDVDNGKLPLKPKPPKTCPIPANEDSINWKVFQEHTYSTNPERDVIESVKFEKISGKTDRLRLEYEVNTNGILESWKPMLIYRQKTVVKTGSPRQYDWINKDPIDFSEYGITKS